MNALLAAMGCPGDVAESVLGHMIPGVAGAYNRHQYDAERVEWLRRLSERLEELARPGRVSQTSCYPARDASACTTPRKI